MARSLVQSKITKAIRAAHGGAVEDDRLPPGHMRLYSFYKPSLQAGPYGIEAKQAISATRGDDTTAQTLTVFNSTSAKDPGGNDTLPLLQQEFSVIAPQFSLDPKLINTYYPPTGHQDEGRILPHIVFNDPHVPWYREAGLSEWMTGPVDTGADGSNMKPDETHGRNFVPWLGLLVFQPDDLKVADTAAESLKLKGMSSYDALKLPADGAFPMTVGGYLSKITSRVYYQAGYQGDSQKKVYTNLQNSTEAMSAIFPLKSQVQDMLGTKDDTTPLQAQKLLAHVRHINTVGFPDAGVEEEGYYSVIVSSMTGNQKEVAPSTHIVHLVSLEHMDVTLSNKNSSFFSTDNSDRIGLVSLFSWTYTCIPDSISFEETMAALANAAQPLRPPTESMEALLSNSLNSTDPVQAKIGMALHDRLNAGYTIARWRAPTGEESVAFNRGPLVPMHTKEVPMPQFSDGSARLWPSLSMTGKDYQIFDGSVGIMDATYSSAWSLGKLMAISDSVFNAALMRFRSTVWSDASSVTRMAVNGVPATATVLQKSLAAVTKAHGVTGDNFRGPVSRLSPSGNQPVVTAVDDPNVLPVFRQAVDKVVNLHASAGAALYNGYDGAPGNNSDWEVICNWLANVLYLANIPAHLLFPEPSHLHSHNQSATPSDQSNFHPEALRFFHIDHAWIDCFIDGALGCANHLEPKYDYTRLRIKAIFNEYLDGTIGNTGIKPPVPRYGFVLRSAVVKSAPDLRLTVTCWMLQTDDKGKKEWVEDPTRDPLIRHTKMDEFTILSLVDCSPEEICLIKIAQPPHQQRFALHSEVGPDASTGLNNVKPHITLKRLYTNSKWAPPVVDPTDGRKPIDPSDLLQWAELKPDQQVPEADQAGWYSADTRCIKPIEITQAATDKLQAWAKDPKYSSNGAPYDDVVPNSCVFGLEMNDPAYQLEINGVAPVDFIPFPAWTRRLWLGQADPSPFIANATRVKATDLKVTAAAPTTPNTVPPKKIALAAPAPTLKAIIPPNTFLNVIKAIPTVPPLKKTSLVDPFINSLAPQFELLIHPDYRPPPPRPFHAPHAASDVFSPLDYLPTQTASLYDLVFAVRRRANLATDLSLQSLTIEIPVSDHGDPKDPDGWIREPLLQAGDYSGTGVRMCANPRFVPALFNGAASSIGSALWDAKAVLGITLVPRSGQQTGAMPLVKDGKSLEASVRLAEAKVHPVVDTRTTALVAQGVDPETGRTANQALPRGRCMVKMTERYADGKGEQWSWCVVLKVDAGDWDPWGNVV